jgi:hypothetical protein
MRRLAALGLILPLLLLLVACSKTASPSASAGIFGTVRAGPICPVEQVGSPCPPQPWSGTVRATAADGHSFETTTDEAGSYALSVPAGSYTVVAVTEDGTLPMGVPNDAVVGDDARIRVDLEVDTGIR